MPYFQSQEFARLSGILHSKSIDLEKCIFIEIGHDGFNVYKHSPWRSTWGVWMRVKNVSPRVSGRYMNVRELALYPQNSRKRYDGVNDTVDITVTFQ